jgi:hypothetical protein
MYNFDNVIKFCYNYNIKKIKRRKTMLVRDELGKRMKKYESVSKTVLMRRTPVIIRAYLDKLIDVGV